MINMSNIIWVNRKNDLEQVINKFKKIEKYQEKINKELEIIRVLLNLQ